METDNVAIQPTATTLSAAIAQAIQESTIVALLEDYGRYLLKHGGVTTMDECKEKIGVVLTAAIDQGIATQNTLQHLERWLSKRTVNTELTCCCKRIEKFFAHALVEEMGEVLEELQLTADPSAAEFMEAYKVYQDLHQRTNMLITKYGDQVKAQAAAFVSSYKQLFDPGFVQKIEQAQQC